MRRPAIAAVGLLSVLGLGCLGPTTDDIVILDSDLDLFKDACTDLETRPDLPGTVYVAWWYEGVSDGSTSAPFRTLEEALATDPSQVVLAPGTYSGDASFTEGDDVELLAACADEVSQILDVLVVDGGTLLLSGVVVDGVDLRAGTLRGTGGELGELEIAGGAADLMDTVVDAGVRGSGIALSGGSLVMLRGEVLGELGLEVTGPATVTASGTTLGTISVSGDGATLTLDEVVLDPSDEAALVVTGDSQVVVRESAVPQTADGLIVQSDGLVQLDRVRATVRRNDSAAISGGRLELSHCVLTADTLTVSGGELVLSDVAVTRSLRSSADFLSVSGGAVALDQVVLLAGEGDRTWDSAVVVEAGSVSAEGLHAAALELIGIGVASQGAVSCSDCLLGGLTGVSVAGGQVSLSDTTLSASVANVYVDGPGSLSWEGGLSRDATYGVVADGVGALAEGNGVSLSGLRLEDHATAALLLDASEADLSDLSFGENGLDLVQQSCEGLTPVVDPPENARVCDGGEDVALPE